MADDRKSYRLTLNGLEHTVLLSPKDAERYGELAVEVKEAAAVANKARKAPANKASAPTPDAGATPPAVPDTK